jgi:hypothetical protein
VAVAFGGGAVGNLASLVAGLLYRGVRLVAMPTTAVAAMDSVLSLKQAVNSLQGKNHFGALQGTRGQARLHGRAAAADAARAGAAFGTVRSTPSSSAQPAFRGSVTC